MRSTLAESICCQHGATELTMIVADLVRRACDERRHRKRACTCVTLPLHDKPISAPVKSLVVVKPTLSAVMTPPDDLHV